MSRPTQIRDRAATGETGKPANESDGGSGLLELDRQWLARTLSRVSRRPTTAHLVRRYRDATVSVAVVEAPPDRQLRTHYRQAAVRRASVRHPRLLPVAGAGEARDRLYVAFETGEATPLPDLFSYGPLSPTLVVVLLRGVAEALDVAASRGLAAYELTPESVFFETGAGGLVGDLGIAREALGAPGVEPDATASFVAPETLKSGIADVRSGVYALGALMYYCGTGGALPDGARQRGAPRPMRRVIARAMASSPEKRYPSGLETVRALEKALVAGGWRVGALAARLPRATSVRRDPRPSSNAPQSTTSELPPALQSWLALPQSQAIEDPPRKRPVTPRSGAPKQPTPTPPKPAPPTPAPPRPVASSSAPPKPAPARPAPAGEPSPAQATSEPAKAARTKQPTPAPRRPTPRRPAAKPPSTKAATPARSKPEPPRPAGKPAKPPTPARPKPGSPRPAAKPASTKQPRPAPSMPTPPRPAAKPAPTKEPSSAPAAGLPPALQSWLAPPPSAEPAPASVKPASAPPPVKQAPAAGSAKPTAAPAPAKPAAAPAPTNGAAAPAPAKPAAAPAPAKPAAAPAQAQPAAARRPAKPASVAASSAVAPAAAPPAALRPWLASPPPPASGASETVALPPAPAVPPQIPRFARLRWPLIAAVALAAVAGAVIGALFAHGSNPEPSPAAATAVSEGVSMTLPSGWDQRDGGAAEVLEAGPIRMPDAGVTVKMSDQEPDRPTGGQPVQLGEFETWRTKDISLKGGESATRYVAPTTEGSLVITCFAPAASSTELLPRCERVAATISLHNGRPLTLDRTIASERRLATAAQNLATERAARRDTLAGAEKRRAQAHAASSLARLYDGAARKLSGEPVAPTLSATAEAYQELADAAKAGDEAGWSTAREDVDRQEAAVDRALQKAAAGP